MGNVKKRAHCYKHQTMKIKNIVLNSFLVLLFLGLSQAVFAYAAKIQETGKTYNTIKEAIAASKDNQTVLIKPGKYDIKDYIQIFSRNLTIKSEVTGQFPNLHSNGSVFFNESNTPITISYLAFMETGQYSCAIATPKATITHCVFDNTYLAINGYSEDGEINIFNCHFTSNYKNITTEGVDVKIERSYFEYDTDENISISNGNLTLAYNEFYDSNELIVENGDVSIEKTNFDYYDIPTIINISNSDKVTLKNVQILSSIEGQNLISISDVNDFEIIGSSITNNDASTILYTKNCLQYKIKETEIRNNSAVCIFRDYSYTSDESLSFEDIEFTNVVLGGNLIYRNINDFRNRGINLLHVTFFTNAYSRPDRAMPFMAKSIVCRNSIIYDQGNEHESGIQLRATHSLDISYSCIKGGGAALACSNKTIGQGITQAYPKFTSNFRLNENSPCINAGCTTTSDDETLDTYIVTSTEVDFDGEDRGITPDLGADEYSECGSGTKSYSAATPFEEESETITAISLYPTPTQGNVTVEGVEAGAVISVFNANGVKVMGTVAEGNVVSFDLSTQPEGVYYVQIITGEETVNKTVMLAK